jgi:hypothetical protein
LWRHSRRPPREGRHHDRTGTGNRGSQVRGVSQTIRRRSRFGVSSEGCGRCGRRRGGPAVADQAPLVSIRAPRPSRTRCRPKV